MLIVDVTSDMNIYGYIHIMHKYSKYQNNIKINFPFSF